MQYVEAVRESGQDLRGLRIVTASRSEVHLEDTEDEEAGYNSHSDVAPKYV